MYKLSQWRHEALAGKKRYEFSSIQYGGFPAQGSTSAVGLEPYIEIILDLEKATGLPDRELLRHGDSS